MHEIAKSTLPESSCVQKATCSLHRRAACNGSYTVDFVLYTNTNQTVVLQKPGATERSCDVCDVRRVNSHGDSRLTRPFDLDGILQCERTGSIGGFFDTSACEISETTESNAR